MLSEEQITAVAELLARNGVQWPYMSRDVRDVEMLKQMWMYILEKHLGGESSGGVKDSVSGRSADGTNAE